jgi:hypothetical protein
VGFFVAVAVLEMLALLSATLLTFNTKSAFITPFSSWGVFSPLPPAPCLSQEKGGSQPGFGIMPTSLDVAIYFFSKTSSHATFLAFSRLEFGRRAIN